MYSEVVSPFFQLSPMEPSKDTGKLSVIVPVYNERATIHEVLKRVIRSPIAKEVIVVDDGSTDGTADILKDLDTLKASLAKESPPAPFDLKVLFHPRNQGKGAAIRTALDAVSGDIVLIQDADLEYDPAEYPILLGPLLDGKADVVYGSRFLGFPHRVLFFWHMVGNKFLTLLSNMLTNLSLTDMETGYKAFRVEVLKDITLCSNRFGFEPEVTAKIARWGARVYEVPISYAGRTYAEGKKINWKDGIDAFWAILRYNLFDDSQAGEKTLRRISRLSRYNAWLWEQVAPLTGQHILEVGAGMGTMTRYLLSREFVLTTDVAPSYLERLKATYEGYSSVVVQPLDLAVPLPVELKNYHFDTVFCLNVLEHIEKDEVALEGFSALLSSGGRVVLVLPALKTLYGKIDKTIGHYRRYDKADIEGKLRRAGFIVERTRFLNVLGIPGWYLNSCLLKRKAVPGLQARLNDLLVPLLKLESRLHLPWGLSLLAVGRKE